MAFAYITQCGPDMIIWLEMARHNANVEAQGLKYNGKHQVFFNIPIFSCFVYFDDGGPFLGCILVSLGCPGGAWISSPPPTNSRFSSLENPLRIRNHFGAIWDRCRVLFGHAGAILNYFEDPEPFWSHMGSISGSFWACWGHFEITWIQF